MQSFTYTSSRHTPTRLVYRVFLVMLGLLTPALLLLDTTNAAIGYSWTKAGTNLTGDTMGWTSIASSSDGTKLAATVDAGYIYLY